MSIAFSRFDDVGFSPDVCVKMRLRTFQFPGMLALAPLLEGATSFQDPCRILQLGAGTVGAPPDDGSHLSITNAVRITRRLRNRRAKGLVMKALNITTTTTTTTTTTRDYYM